MNETEEAGSRLLVLRRGIGRHAIAVERKEPWRREFISGGRTWAGVVGSLALHIAMG